MSDVEPQRSAIGPARDVDESRRSVSSGSTAHGASTDDVDDQLPARPEDYDQVPVAVRIDAAADSMEAVNRLLWQVVRSILMVAALLGAILLVAIAYWLASIGGVLP